MITEKEKAKAGVLYNANYDEQLLKERLVCRQKCQEYNLIPVSLLNEKELFIKQLFAKVGTNPIIEQPFQCDYGYNIEVGNNFYSNVNLVILDGAKVTFGDNVFIAPNCGLYTAGHPLDAERRNEGLEYALPIVVGNNVWIGAGVSVLPGVTIWNNSVIGAGSVVTKDIPHGVIAVGNPCRVVRQITEDDKDKW